jgi:hypothetical protein
VGLLDEPGEHFLRVLEIGDDAVLHRADRDDVSRRPTEHILGVSTDRLDTAGLLVHRDDGGLGDDDPPPLRVHERVGRAQIDG